MLQTAVGIYAERGDQTKLWGSMIKQTLKRRRPGFNESFYGFSSFNDLLEEAQARGQLELELDERSRWVPGRQGDGGLGSDAPVLGGVARRCGRVQRVRDGRTCIPPRPPRQNRSRRRCSTTMVRTLGAVQFSNLL